MAHKKSFPAVEQKQRQFVAEKTQAEQAPRGKQPHEIAERANMKRQKKQMHAQDNK